jgi:hypothetical protein
MRGFRTRSHRRPVFNLSPTFDLLESRLPLDGSGSGGDRLDDFDDDGSADAVAVAYGVPIDPDVIASGSGAAAGSLGGVGGVLYPGPASGP